MRDMRRPLARTILIAAQALTLSACTSGPDRVATENDRLRAKALEMEAEIRSLQGRNAELEQQLKQASRTPATVSEEIAAATPHVVAVSLGRLSHARDDDADGRYDSLVLYLEPVDGLGRFMQIVGSVAMHAAVLPAEGPAQTIGQATIGPKALRDDYRSSFGGPSYALTLPIEHSTDATQCTVRVVFTDGYSGQEFSTERAIELK
jgi:hypothetical protein